MGIVLWILLVCLVGAIGMSGVSLADLAESRQRELLHLLRHDCGSCHGMRLLGGLGPPLTPEALSGKSREALHTLILEGVPGLAMPPWKAILGPEEVYWLLDRLFEGIPE